VAKEDGMEFGDRGRVRMGLLGGLAMGIGCGAQPVQPEVTAPAGVDARMVALAESLDGLTDLEAVANEVLVTPDGCEVRRWTQVGIGVGPAFVGDGNAGLTLQDRSVEYNGLILAEDAPEWLRFALAEDGKVERAGVSWRFMGDEAPDLFDDVGTDIWVREPYMSDWLLSAWLWVTSPDNHLGWFGMSNAAMEGNPAWLWENREAVVYSIDNLQTAFGGGTSAVPLGACIEGADGDVGHPQIVGQVGTLDVNAPDTHIRDAAGQPLAVQWTWPDDGGPPPSLFGRPLDGPDADGNYFRRMWLGYRLNPRGIFHPSLPEFSCADPPPEPECAHHLILPFGQTG
jgi:hypothetical protein